MNKFYLVNMKKHLTPEYEKMLKMIYEPVVVAIPPSDACRNMCVTPEGEIRIYGSINKKEPDDVGTLVYISSRNCGISWEMHLMSEMEIGSAGCNYKTHRYISVYPNEFRPDLRNSFGKKGTWAIINDEGYNGTNNRFIKLSDKFVHILKLPMYLEEFGRWFIIGEHKDEYKVKRVVVFCSDDDGETWNETVIERTAPKFNVVPPHEGTRWQEYSCEPTVTELMDGTLLMIVRTSMDYHYMYRSFDGGITWTGPERTNFHGTITMPVLQRLSDGRIVFFWCNSQPMPERDLNKVFPRLSKDEEIGVWEDVFTNRDINHLAISEDDAKTWIGFRELYLNTIRNNADFRSIGGLDSRDKSVHQAQIIELPYNKLLIHFGQNAIARKVVVLDINWLYEHSRYENFRFGLQNVSTHMFIESNLGGYRGFSGHCAYNRTNGALLVPDPEGNFREVLQICRVEDKRLLCKQQGVVWNFPASKKGNVVVRLRVLNSGVRISLLDHWINPSDETVAKVAQFSFIYEEKSEIWTEINIKYDVINGIGELRINGKKREYLKSSSEAPNGICYLHIQTNAESEDFEGTIIKELKAERIV